MTPIEAVTKLRQLCRLAQKVLLDEESKDKETARGDGLDLVSHLKETVHISYLTPFVTDFLQAG